MPSEQTTQEKIELAFEKATAVGASKTDVVTAPDLDEDQEMSEEQKEKAKELAEKLKKAEKEQKGKGETDSGGETVSGSETDLPVGAGVELKRKKVSKVKKELSEKKRETEERKKEFEQKASSKIKESRQNLERLKPRLSQAEISRAKEQIEKIKSEKSEILSKFSEREKSIEQYKQDIEQASSKKEVDIKPYGELSYEQQIKRIPESTVQKYDMGKKEEQKPQTTRGKIESVFEKATGREAMVGKAQEPSKGALKEMRKKSETHIEKEIGKNTLERGGFLTGARWTASTVLSEKSEDYLSSFSPGGKKPEEVVAEQTGETIQSKLKHGGVIAGAIGSAEYLRSLPGRVSLGFIGGQAVTSGTGAIAAKTALGAKLARTGLSMAGAAFATGKVASVGQKVLSGEVEKAIGEAANFGALAGGFALGSYTMRPKLSEVSQESQPTLVKKGGKLVGKGKRSVVEYTYKQPRMFGRGTRTITRTAEVTPEIIQAGDKSYYQAGEIKYKGPKGHTIKSEPYVTSGIKETPRKVMGGELSAYSTKTEVSGQPTKFGQSLSKSQVMKEFQNPISGEIHNVASLSTEKGELSISSGKSEVTLYTGEGRIGIFKKQPNLKGFSGTVSETSTGKAGLIQVEKGTQIEAQLASNIQGMTAPQGNLGGKVTTQSFPPIADLPVTKGIDEEVVGKAETEEVSGEGQKSQQVENNRLTGRASKGRGSGVVVETTQPRGQVSKIEGAGVVVEAAPKTDISSVSSSMLAGAEKGSVVDKTKSNLAHTLGQAVSESTGERGKEIQETSPGITQDIGLIQDTDIGEGPKLGLYPRVTTGVRPEERQLQTPKLAQTLAQTPVTTTTQTTGLTPVPPTTAPKAIPILMPGQKGTPKMSFGLNLGGETEKQIGTRGVKPDIISATISEFQTGKAEFPAGEKARSEYFKKKKEKGPLMTFPTLQERKGQAKFKVSLNQNKKEVNFL